MAHVLVVEDDQAVRELVRNILELEGHDVSLARNGVDALSRIDESIPDLVMLDLMMPEMNGWRFLETLRVMGIRDRVRVVIVSAATDDATLGRARREGAFTHLAKPFTAPDLVSAVNGALAHDPADLLRRHERVGSLLRLIRGLETVAP